MKVENKNRLSVIGRLIGIYREELKRRGNNNYTLKRFTEGICTINTYKKIEKGGCSRSIEIYEGLLEKCNLKFNYFPDIDDTLLLDTNNLYESIEYYRIDEVLRYCDKALRILGKVKSYVYYSELYNIYYDLRKYYAKDTEIDLEKLERYMKIYSLVDKGFHQLLKRLILAKAQILAIHNLTVYNSIVSELDAYTDDYKSMKLQTVHFYYINEKYDSMKDLLKSLEIYFDERENYVRLLDVYNYYVLLYSKIEKSRKSKYIKEINLLIQNHNIPLIKASESYSSIGSVLHNENQFENSLYYFGLMQDIVEDIYLPYALYIADCQRHLGLPMQIPNLTHLSLWKYSRSLQIMYNYYYHYNKLKPFVRQNLIIKEIVPYLIDEDLIKIFRYELSEAVKVTNNYKALLLFDAQIEKNKS